MTVTYSDDIATARLSTLFNLLLRRWRGSVFKLLWRDLLIYLTIYYSIHFTNMFFLNEAQQDVFRSMVRHTATYQDGIPMPFVLGFFVSNVMTRWWDQYQTIPWPYGIAVYVSSMLHGYDEVGRAMRRTILRYVCLSLTMVFRVLAIRVKQRYPLMSDLVGAGLLTDSELHIIETLESKYPGYSKNWLPICWAASIVNRARSEGRIRDDFAVKTIIKELNKFRGNCGILMNYNSINIPLVYTQVVAIAVYTYFLISLVSHQFYKGKNDIEAGWNLDYFPLLIVMQFIFYMGWLKVAETMLNPFGEDDDDFEVNFMIDRNLQMSYLIVDEMHNEHPELLKDAYWDEIPAKLPGRTNEENKETTTDADIVDFTDRIDKKASKAALNTTTKPILIDVENSKDSLTRSITSSTADLQPKSSVIAENYRKLPDVEKRQSILARQMEIIRKTTLHIEDSPTTSEEEIVTSSRMSSIDRKSKDDKSKNE